MFLKFFGKDRDPATLSQRDWDRFIRDRRSGRVGPSGKPVSDRTIERDLRFLLAVLNWAAKSRDEQGQLLLESNPLRGLKTPTEKNPTRVLLTELEYEALLEVSLEMDWRFRVASVIAQTPDYVFVTTQPSPPKGCPPMFTHFLGLLRVTSNRTGASDRDR